MTTPFIPLEIPMINSVVQSDHFRSAASRTEHNGSLVEPRPSTDREILSRAARDLRSPLSQVKTLVSTLLRSDVDWDDAMRHQFITRIDHEIDQLVATVGARLNTSGETTRDLASESGPPTLDGQAGIVSISKMLEAALILGAQIADSQELPASVDPEILTPNRAEELSERELDVLRLIGIGRSNKQIAKELAITPNTVKTHVSSILGKLGLESRTQAALYMPCLATWPGKRSTLRPAFSSRVIGDHSVSERHQSGRVPLSAS